MKLPVSITKFGGLYRNKFTPMLEEILRWRSIIYESLFDLRDVILV